MKSAVKHSNQREPLGFVYFGLVLFMVAYFARPQDWIPGLAGVPLMKITGSLILLALVFSFNSIRWHMPQEVIFLSLLMVQLWLAVPFSPVWRGAAFYMMLDFSKVLPLIIVIYAVIRSMRRFRRILFVQAASGAAIAIASIVMADTPGERLRAVFSRVYENSNDLAFALDISLPLCLALALMTRSLWKKLAWSIAILAMIYAVFLTASRGGAIALVVGALVCLWQLGVKSRRFVPLLLVSIVVIVLWLHGGDALRKRFDQTDTGSAQQRKELLIRSLEVTAQYPLFGVGPGNFPIVSRVWLVTHNSYTQMSAEGGIPAFLLYVLIFWRGMANLREVRKYRKAGKEIRLFSIALEASLAAYLVGSFFASAAFQLFPYCIVAYTGTLLLIGRRDQDDKTLSLLLD